jgi:L-cystine uptake protein TcyP (sodium:dicarboxylate symporter family)
MSKKPMKVTIQVGEGPQKSIATFEDCSAAEIGEACHAMFPAMANVIVVPPPALPALPNNLPLNENPGGGTRILGQKT